MIRKRIEDDNDEIFHIWNEASRLAHTFFENTYIEKLSKDLSEVYIPTANTWVYVDDDSVVGFISMLGNEIGGLFVLPFYHSKGIGTKLVNCVQELYGDLEVEVFEKNHIGRAFYEKYGFKKLKRYLHSESGNYMLRLFYTNLS